MKEDSNKKIKEALAKKINDALNKNYKSDNPRWITRKELAKIAGISESVLYLVLKGEASVDSALKVCKVLNIKLL